MKMKPCGVLNNAFTIEEIFYISGVKRIFLFVSILLSLNLKGQCQFHFYGHELSNYEVGDTLIYTRWNWTSMQGGDCYRNQFYTIINKGITGTSDSIIYTLQYVFSYSGQGCWPSASGIDTFQTVISNDTVYDNNNNLFFYGLHKMDFDTSILLPPFDSTFVRYDTTSGLKRLKSKYISSMYGYGYLAIENIGLIYFGEGSEDPQFGSWSSTLKYAHLANYGIYGTYFPVIYNDIADPEKTQSEISIYPNPATNEIKISNLSSEENQITIYNLLGQQVKNISVSNEQNHTINISDLPSGIYMLTVSNNKKINCKKFVKE